MIDIGINLTNKRFDKDLSSVIDNAKLAGVNALIVTGTSISREPASARTLFAIP